MKIAEQAMIQYTRQGHENAKAHEAVLQAVTALKLDGLKDLGVFVDTAGLSMDKEADRGKILEKVFQQLTVASREFGNQSLSDAEKLTVSANKVANAIDTLKSRMGQGLGKGVSFVDEAATYYMANFATGGMGRQLDDANAGRDAREFYSGLVGQANAARHRAELYNEYMAGQSGGTSDEFRISRQRQMIDEGLLKDPGAIALDLGGKIWKGIEEGAKRGNLADRDMYTRDVATGGKSLIEQIRDSLRIELLAFEATSRGRDDATDALGFRRPDKPNDLGVAAVGSYDLFSGDLTSRLRNTTANAYGSGYTRDQSARAGYAYFNRGRSESRLSDMFGPLEEFNAYKMAFDSLSGAVGSALGAWIDGSMSAGKAFKAFLGEAVKGIAIQMAMEALKHGAYAIGSLAFGDPAGAALHAKAALAFGAGAAAASVAAKELHSGGGGASSAGHVGAPPIGGAGGYGGGGGSAERPIVMIIGDPYDDETNGRRRRQNAERTVQRVLGDSSGGSY